MSRSVTLGLHGFGGVMKATLIALLAACSLGLTACPVAAEHGEGVARVQPQKVIAAGDSITWGGPPWAREGVQYPSELERLSGGELDVTNVGNPGACLLFDPCPGYKTLIRETLAEKVWPKHPDVVIVGIGANDLGARLPTSKLKAQYRAIRADGARAGVKVLLATISPGRHFWPPDCEAQRQELNAWIRTLPHVDFDAALANPADQMRGRFDSGDGLHPSSQGYRSMAREAWQVLAG